MSIYKYVTPLFVTDRHSTEDKRSRTSQEMEEDELCLSDLDAPCLLLSDDDASSCADHEDSSEWPLSWDSMASRTRKDDEVLEQSRGRVRFNNARVRIHGVTLGDHPMCCDPLPLSLDWCHSDEIVYDINEYEALRNSQCSRGERARTVQRLTYRQRKRMLQEGGVCHLSCQFREYDDDADLKCDVNDQDPDFYFDGSDHSDHDWYEEEIESIYNFSFPGSMISVEIIED
eukprot:scaffold4617_cov106-Cylindrotheca_fusiformis.AAC.2